MRATRERAPVRSSFATRAGLWCKSWAVVQAGGGPVEHGTKLRGGLVVLVRPGLRNDEHNAIKAAFEACEGAETQ